MKLLLMTTPVEQSATYADFSFAAPVIPPLGLAYIAALLEQEGIEVRILDCVAQNITMQKLIAIIKEYCPDVVGISCATITYHKAKHVLEKIKQEFPKITLLMGGPHITALKQDVFTDCPALDIGVFGEGEYTMLEIMKGGPLQEIAGIIYRSGNEVHINPPRPLICDLNSLPFPARHLLPTLDTYKHTPLRAFKGRMLNMITSRGCPFGCAYCDQTTFGKKWRAHSVGYIFGEIDSISEKIDFISFEDDNFALDKQRLKKFCQTKIKRKDAWVWACSMRLDSINEEMAKLMKKAGCKLLFFGIESGNEDMLRYIGKKINLDLINEKIKIAKKNKIGVYGSFILALPKDTDETIQQTINCAKSLGLDGVSFNLFVPYPNTSLRVEAKKYGKVSDNWEDYSDHSNNPPFIPFGKTKEDLLSLQKKAYRQVYMSPKYMLRHLNKIFSINFILQSLKALRVFLK